MKRKSAASRKKKAQAEKHCSPIPPGSSPPLYLHPQSLTYSQTLGSGTCTKTKLHPSRANEKGEVGDDDVGVRVLAWTMISKNQTIQGTVTQTKSAGNNLKRTLSALNSCWAPLLWFSPYLSALANHPLIRRRTKGTAVHYDQYKERACMSFIDLRTNA